MPENYPTSISITPETKRKLKEFSQARGWPMSRLIEYIVLEWLKYQETKKK